ncbi:hypothetical protein SAMN02745116_00441 [Pilibacter termitis]|uniref:Uncharacterized protein n=2 Tax=Pilibacter termitis TaxID=263852 RepID=A0A1T4KZK6_9ENTE|nr:hypothetical protein SAMN02745116_00441 [Pilibacter termitis]
MRQRAISEIAEYLGHTLESPISLSLLFVELGLSEIDFEQIHQIINEIINPHYNNGEYELQDFVIQINNYLMTKEITLSEMVIVGMLKGFSKSWFPELYTFAHTL